MERTKCAVSTVCYLTREDKTLFIKFNKKWGNVYAPPGGKICDKESPLECIEREYQEETGLMPKNIKLKSYCYWNYQDQEYGLIFIYTANDYEGILEESKEGKLFWIDNEEIPNLAQFDMNTKFSDLIFQGEIFEGRFDLDKDHKVKTYTITKI